MVANGHRTTITYPVGSVGNDKEFANTIESWMSPALKRDVLTKRNDPRFGEQISKLVNISTSEPDPGLFQVPEGYTVSDEEDFKIEWRAQRQ